MSETQEIDECRYCSKSLAEHETSRAEGAPVPRMPCLGLKSHFLARVVATEPPAPAPALELREPYPVLKFFAYKQLPDAQQLVSKPFGDLAHALAATLPFNRETTKALDKLLEAKDCAVRASLP